MLKKILDISIIIYFDDIFIFSKIKEKYIKHVKKMLTALTEKNLQINLKKYKQYKKKVEFLEFRVGKNKIRILSKKIKIIREWSRSTIVKHI